ncbi:hypothetical protein AMJ74_03310 [candidate division WOR_3 bacterium SM1_77]|jgi:hypothetical protein|uniref:LVIVD repeat-containing protein n=1 Tax=candidate division WOR_3 bacterium SM1_77 TaxID=1703778 RepID=A0A0S8K0R7_UNCW3|nr:MAG: hypothetical protein AMJ74_03310 [candidate division WOR_3 bacterium SM1_77]
MHAKTVDSTLIACRASKYAALILLASISCLDFQFESEYEDINGLHIEHVHSYSFVGTKILFNGSMGYIANAESLLVYDFTEVDAAVYLGYYAAYNSINDFQICDNCAVLVTDTGIEIVDISDSLPNQLSAVPMFFFGGSVKIDNDNAYVVSPNQLHVVDISDRQNPTLTNSYAFNDNIRQVEIDSNFAYVLVGTDFWVLNVQNPSVIIPIDSTSLPALDIFHPEAFFKKGSFIYFASYTTFAAWLSTCELTLNKDTQVLNHIVVPDRVRKFHMSDEYTLAVSWYAAFLINLRYPTSPCISEETGFGGIDGTIRDDYIFLLTPNLVIFEIKQVE